eukprot:CAMPEP_0119310008 /NCGR_PEP_ID=MMETSP1333-20130426/17653_1 /TAXON_ID=418940 /ORGANISM="Scyphosphaera apsteinii, Strain RCC1455" /LENGTH=418 /DNA_ID=CAMNT_0007314123 /DNA_START=82 /DNA_END=1339 /DNA_ORIENTATION=-
MALYGDVLSVELEGDVLGSIELDGDRPTNQAAIVERPWSPKSLSLFGNSSACLGSSPLSPSSTSGSPSALSRRDSLQAHPTSPHQQPKGLRRGSALAHYDAAYVLSTSRPVSAARSNGMMIRTSSGALRTSEISRTPSMTLALEDENDENTPAAGVAPIGTPVRQRRDEGVTRFREVLVHDNTGIVCGYTPSFLRAAEYGGYAQGGVLITGLGQDNSAAVLAGLLVGDVITRVNGELVDRPEQAMNLIQKIENVPVALTVVDASKLAFLRRPAHGNFGLSFCSCSGDGGVVLGAIAPGASHVDMLMVGMVILSVQGQIVHSPNEADHLLSSITSSARIVYRDRCTQLTIDKSQGRLGLTLSDTKGYGVRVTAASPHGPAAAAGLRVNDVILSIDGTLITCHKQAVELIDDRTYWFSSV